MGLRGLEEGWLNLLNLLNLLNFPPQKWAFLAWSRVDFKLFLPKNVIATRG